MWRGRSAALRRPLGADDRAQIIALADLLHADPAQELLDSLAATATDRRSAERTIMSPCAAAPSSSGAPVGGSNASPSAVRQSHAHETRQRQVMRWLFAILALAGVLGTGVGNGRGGRAGVMRQQPQLRQWRQVMLASIVTLLVSKFASVDASGR